MLLYTLSQKTHQLWQAVVSTSMDDFNSFLVKQHQHTLENDMHVQLSLYLHFYLLYLVLNSCDGNDAF